MQDHSEHADGEQEVSQTRQQIIDQIVIAAHQPCPNIVKRSVAIGTNSQHYACGFPVGVEHTGERFEYFAFQSPDGPTYGKQFATRAELEAHHVRWQEQQDHDFRRQLSAMTDAKVQEQSDYWASRA